MTVSGALELLILLNTSGTEESLFNPPSIEYMVAPNTVQPIALGVWSICMT